MEQGKAERKKEDTLGRLVLGRRGYHMGRLLGKGAFSRVYYVEGMADGRNCACKVSGNIRLLEREAQVMAVLNHSLFSKHFGFWREAGLGFLMCEYIPGCSLEEMLMRRGHFTAEQTIRVGLALAEGLKYLHERQERFLFRDVKPSNIMVRQDGRVKLIDPGCVCSMEEPIFSRAGTPDFAAPEQLQKSGELTPACDVYGLGRTLEVMLGEEPCSDRKKPALHKNRLPEKRFDFIQKNVGTENMREKKKRKDLRRILDACTKRDAAERIPDMSQVSIMLGRLGAGSEAVSLCP